jgi:malate dehydrogenase (oxaloacetate-decarboxylating)(NADP+)
MVRSMGRNPIIFAMANPDPEISYAEAREARPDCIIGTGRSDFPNQINNVSGFPYIFRGALDVRAVQINEEMKLAAARAVAALAREPVPGELLDRYGLERAEFGPDYVVPLAMDPRLLEWEASAVAKAAMDSGVARVMLDIGQYKIDLNRRIEASQKRIADFVRSYDYPF